MTSVRELSDCLNPYHGLRKSNAQYIVFMIWNRLCGHLPFSHAHRRARRAGLRAPLDDDTKALYTYPFFDSEDLNILARNKPVLFLNARDMEICCILLSPVL